MSSVGFDMVVKFTLLGLLECVPRRGTVKGYGLPACRSEIFRITSSLN